MRNKMDEMRWMKIKWTNEIRWLDEIRWTKIKWTNKIRWLDKIS